MNPNKNNSNQKSLTTLWKVLRFIGRYRFLLILSILFGLHHCRYAVICANPVRRCD